MKTRRYSKPIVVLMFLPLSLPLLWLLAREQRQYALNRGLADAMHHTDNQNALALVNAGADPNIPYTPSFMGQFEYLLHLNRLPLGNANSVFMKVCNREVATYDRKNDPNFERDDLPLLQAMVAHGADITAANHGDTALHFAVCADRWRIVEWLLQHGADINAQDEGGYTPLIMAVSQEHTNIARLLLAHGADPNLQNTHGWTALYYATHQFPAPAEMITSLVAHGADTNHRHD